MECMAAGGVRWGCGVGVWRGGWVTHLSVEWIALKVVVGGWVGLGAGGGVGVRGDVWGMALWGAG